MTTDPREVLLRDAQRLRDEVEDVIADIPTDVRAENTFAGLRHVSDLLTQVYRAALLVEEADMDAEVTP